MVVQIGNAARDKSSLHRPVIAGNRGRRPLDPGVPQFESQEAILTVWGDWGIPRPPFSRETSEPSYAALQAPGQTDGTMLFCSLEFLPFFVLVFSLYWLLPWNQARVGLLLAASFWFYSSWNSWLAILIVASTTIDFAIGLGLERCQNLAARRALLATSITFNLGLLAYFKYVNFFLESLQEALHLAGWQTNWPLLQVLLPVGISFYTFEAISYTVDVYLGRVRAERHLSHLLLFVLFFPHLVAGPIVRARDFLPQVARPKRWSWLRAQWGAELFLLGLVKKLLIADRMALLADPVFANPDQYGTAAVWFGVVAYGIQIYGDFSGYSDMAIGLAHLLGYRLGVNFRRPYLAQSMSEFWHRWHISLSTWLRDYVYIPLGGSRGTNAQTERNLLITMGLGGLWHGASWPFVLWGLLHGMLLIADRRLRAASARRPECQAWLQTRAGQFACTASVVLCVSLGWVLFRAPSLSVAVDIYRRLFWPVLGSGLKQPMAGYALLLAGFVMGQWLVEQGHWRRRWRELPAGVQMAGYALAALLVGFLAPSSGQAFIYFQF